MLYSEAIGRAQPYTGRRIEQMERNDDFPQDEARRWVLAKIVQLGVSFSLSSLNIPIELPEIQHKETKSLLPLKAMKFDLTNHQTFLKHIWTQKLPGTLEEVEDEFFDRIHDISLKNSYISDKRKKLAVRTLCGLHMVFAVDIYSAQNNAVATAKHMRLAALLARENHLPDWYAAVMLQYGIFFLDQGNYQAAIDTILAAKKVKKFPQQLHGKILGNMGRAKARVAQTETERAEALSLLDESESMIGQSSLDDFDFLVEFNTDKYLAGRSEVLIGSPVKHLQSPEKASSYLPVTYRASDISEERFRLVGSRQAHWHRLQAEIAIAQDQYPLAVALAEEALTYLERLQARGQIKNLVRICTLLKQSPYGDSKEVAMLEIRIMRNLYPELFG